MFPVQAAPHMFDGEMNGVSGSLGDGLSESVLLESVDLPCREDLAIPELISEAASEGDMEHMPVIPSQGELCQ